MMSPTIACLMAKMTTNFGWVNQLQSCWRIPLDSRIIHERIDTRDCACLLNRSL